jgi:hypothetical protein
MNNWKGAFLAPMLSGIVVGILDGNFLIWIWVGIALGMVLAFREYRRAGDQAKIEKSRNHEAA